MIWKVLTNPVYLIKLASSLGALPNDTTLSVAAVDFKTKDVPSHRLLITKLLISAMLLKSVFYIETSAFVKFSIGYV